MHDSFTVLLRHELMKNICNILHKSEAALPSEVERLRLMHSCTSIHKYNQMSTRDITFSNIWLCCNIIAYV